MNLNQFQTCCVHWLISAWPPEVCTCSMQLFSHSHNNVPQEAQQIGVAVAHFLYLHVTGEKRTEENLLLDICKNFQIRVLIKPYALRTECH